MWINTDKGFDRPCQNFERQNVKGNRLIKMIKRNAFIKDQSRCFRIDLVIMMLSTFKCICRCSQSLVLARRCHHITALASKSLEGNIASRLTRDVHTRRLHTTPSLQVSKYVTGRDPEQEEKEKKIISSQTDAFFEEAARRDRNKETFKLALKQYLNRNDKYRRGHVEFMYASLKHIKEFDADRDIETYRQILEIFPKHKMVAKTMWQAEFMHYPKQQQCCIDILDRMEESGVVPDDDMGYQLVDIFGPKSHAFRKYQRMMYWMPKFKYANPYWIPHKLPDDRIELAKMVLNRMSVDIENNIDVFQTADLETSIDQTFVASAQSPTQQELLSGLPPGTPVYVEGGFDVWMRHLKMTYFILRAEVSQRVKDFEEAKENYDETDTINWQTMFDDEKPRQVILPPSLHEQDDGTLLATCLTGTSSKDSVASWIKFLERTNPALKQLPVVFLLRTPEAGIQVYDAAQEDRDKAAANMG